MYFNRWDIVMGHYVFYALWHEGQTSERYARLCRILKYFKPSPRGINLDDSGNENARDIYLNLCERYGCTHEGEIRV